MFSPDGPTKYIGIYHDIQDALIDAKTRFEDRYLTIHDNFGERLEDLELGRPDYKRCSYQYLTSYIGGDLKAYRCCVYSYSDRGEIAGGDLSTNSFKTYWNSAARKADFERFDARGCERCQFNEKNRAINYMLEEDPEHKEFP